MRNRHHKSSRDTPQFWLKSLYYHGTWSIKPKEETWIGTPGVRDRNGVFQRSKDGTPKGKPSWKPGDLIVLCYQGSLKAPIIVEVLDREIRHQPDWAQAHSWGGEPDAGVRWPWVTWIIGRHAINVDEAPSITDVGISPQALQGGRKRLTDDEYHWFRQRLR